MPIAHRDTAWTAFLDFIFSDHLEMVNIVAKQ